MWNCLQNGQSRSVNSTIVTGASRWPGSAAPFTSAITSSSFGAAAARSGSASAASAIRARRTGALLEDALHQLAHLGGIARHLDAARFHHRELLLRCALAAGDDRAGVAHALAGRRGEAGDESH